MHKITVCGSGVLGTQIAYQAALHGYSVCLHNVSEAGLGRGRDKVALLPERVGADLQLPAEQTQAALARIRYTTDLPLAVQDADLVIESIPENLDLKLAFYREVSALAGPQTILATNTSTLLPSRLSSAVQHPQRFLALHFAAQVWRNTMAELMPTPETSREVYAQVVDFALSIGMVPIELQKEQPGYLINSLLLPLLDAGLDLAVREVAHPHDIDRTWMLGTRAAAGPFAMLDTVGLSTAYHIYTTRSAAGDARAGAAAEYLRPYLERGHTGAAAGQGFYTHPNPAYLSPDFLSKRRS